MRLITFRPGDSAELLDRFLDLPEPAYRPDRDVERQRFDYYGRRPDYRFELVLVEDGRDVARSLVGRCDAFPWAFFGSFDCDGALPFRVVTSAARESARRLGARELRGPIELNGMHGWQFVVRADSPERWVGDPWHRPGHPGLFREAGWEIGDESTSGVLPAFLVEGYAREYPAVAAEFAREGFELRRVAGLPVDDWLPSVWRLVREAFTPESHRFVPVEYEVFRAELAPFLGRLTDPDSILLARRGDEVVGFLVGHPNLSASVPAATDFSARTVAVAGDLRGGAVWKMLFMTFTEAARLRYGARAGWRRVNRLHPKLHRFVDSGRVTRAYATFRTAIG